MTSPARFRRTLLNWFDAHRRDLPWRTRSGELSPGFYKVWISEIMLQQTRVEAVVPYYEKFLRAFPEVQTLARAQEPKVLAHWSGLGYYSRARNLHRAAKQISATGVPETYEDLRALPGVGPYTAAAIASIALNLPHAAIDGNVIRVVSRLTNDSGEITSTATRRRIDAEAARILDPRRPGDFNQAMMELGATVCVPRTPRCPECPVARFCLARAEGTAADLPIKLRQNQTRDVILDLGLFVRRRTHIFLVARGAQSRRLAGFHELPALDLVPSWTGKPLPTFSHQIVNDRFRVHVYVGPPPRRLPVGKWYSLGAVDQIPLTTITRKALAAASRSKMIHIPPFP